MTRGIFQRALELDYEAEKIRHEIGWIEWKIEELTEEKESVLNTLGQGWEFLKDTAPSYVHIGLEKALKKRKERMEEINKEIDKL